MKGIISWERRGIHMFVLANPGNNSHVIVLFGFPRGHPYYHLRRKHMPYRFKRDLLDRVMYAGWRTNQREYWYIGLNIVDIVGPGGVGEAIIAANHFVDSLSETPSLQVQVTFP